MSSFGTILGKTSTYAQAFGVADITSQEMRTAIPMWFDMYFRTVAGKNEDPCQRIPYTIVSKLSKTVFSEYEATSKDEFASRILIALSDKRMEAMQMALIGGESLLKPIPEKNGICFAVIPRYNVLVFGRDAYGNMTDVGTVEKTAQGRFYYTLLERRTVDTRGYLTIKNRLFQSYTNNDLGQAVRLDTLPQYAQLPEEYTFSMPVGSIGLISLRTPMVNCVDGSADSVSVYAAAVGLIHNIDRNEAQLNGEFERGESRVFASTDVLRKKPTKETDRIFTPPGENYEFTSHLFAGLDGDPDDVGITIFSPALREASFLARKQEYLRNVENVIGLKRGLLSEVEAAERTATEITSSAGEYNLTIIDFQRMWEITVKEAMRVCAVLGQLYNTAGAHEIAEDTVIINWGNGVLYDESKRYQEIKEQVAIGLLQPERLLGWYYNLPCDSPTQRAKIRKDYMPEAVEEPDEEDE